MKMYLFFCPENLNAFLSDGMPELYLSYKKDDKYYGDIQIEITDYKYNIKVNSDFVVVTKKK